MNMADMRRSWARSSIGSEILFLLPALAVGLYEIYDSLYVRLAPFEKQSYGVLVLTCLVGAVLGMVRMPPSARALAWLTVIVIAGLLPLYPLKDLDPGDRQKLVWALADIGVLLLPVLLFLWLQAVYDSGRMIRAVGVMAVMHGVAAAFAPLTGTGLLAMPGADPALVDTLIYDAASPLLMATLWFALMTRRTAFGEALVGLCIVATSVQIVFSEDRAAVIASILIPLLLGLLNLRKARRAGYVMTLLGCLAVAATANTVGISTAFQSVRDMAHISSSPGTRAPSDQSINRRVMEMSELLKHWSNDYSLTDTVTGQGYGAAFEPQPPSVNERNFDALGRVHHIHNTYMALLYRYGFPVLILICSIYCHLTVKYTETVFRQEKSGDFSQIMSILGIIYLTFGVMNNVMAEPVASLVLAYGLLVAAGPSARARDERSDRAVGQER